MEGQTFNLDMNSGFMCTSAEGSIYHQDYATLN